MGSPVLSLEANTRGKDYVVGDIHGSYNMVLDAMRAVSFDGSKDRLFCVGDLIDRGAGSKRVLQFLAQPYVFSVMGNHEGMFLEIYADGIPDERLLRVLTSNNGMEWWMQIDGQTRAELIARFAKLPLVIELETHRGTVGLLHAEVPIGMSWDAFKAKVADGDKVAIQSALWGRTRAKLNDDSGVDGVGRMFVGHTPQWNGLKRLGNVYYLDTGAVFHDIGAKDAGRLTLANMVAHTGDLIEGKPHIAVDVRDGRVPNSPFGTSLVSSL